MSDYDQYISNVPFFVSTIAANVVVSSALIARPRGSLFLRLATAKLSGFVIDATIP